MQVLAKQGGEREKGWEKQRHTRSAEGGLQVSAKQGGRRGSEG